MSQASNFDVELAEARVEREREAGVNAVRARLQGAGAADCVDCGEEIPPARRRAMPSARRCAGCQTRIEGRHR
ncbi:TraR/DksA C4-type zinc finger protein [Polymorphum gilvum]|uniref:Zinc finger DksA/TraR C4-type domain-containing protein n=1 Tax=Polymorphum gilvum (strain LMG 25793 / CGMCC 1.9160 / SL003B-26A1) TaxID=991905 RepID=F2J5L9_POLGS|nr:TraR/DksA C4-type zinc finger protein [Polymorphum gilvum]ADZ70103.1 hypothetical protein SL003B_1675 [Polymorphum gilvum SL003B-26A1]